MRHRNDLERLVLWICIAALVIGAIALWFYSPAPQPPGPTAPTPLPPVREPTPTLTAGPTSQCIYRGQLPDPVCTPGAIDPRVTQENIATTICRSGYTATVRPPVTYTDRLKAQQLAEYGQDPSRIRSFEEDHYVPLELGGHPTDPKNLWPEPGASPNAKDHIENELHAAVCANPPRITLAEAQRRIETDWTHALEGL